MKTSLNLFMICLMLTSCSGQNNKVVPNCVQENFKKMYPQAIDIDWDLEGKFYTVEFDVERIEKEAWYDKDCNWRMTENDISYMNLPQPILDAISNSNYSTWKIDDIDYIERNDHTPFYVVEIEQGERERMLFYDATGKLLKDATGWDESHKNPNSSLGL